MNKKGAHILIVDDDAALLGTLRSSLEQNGYEVLTAKSGEESLEKIARHRIDLIILDIMLPDMSGLEVCEQIRAQVQSPLPIIILSVKRTPLDKVEALDLGADDYVVKPFDTLELLARIRRALQRIHPTGSVFTIGPLRVDFSQRSVKRDGKEIDLTPIEYEILKVMIHNRGRVITPKMLLSMIWGDEFGFNPHHVYVYIHSLRKKIETDIASPRFILTVHRLGYRFTTDD